MKMGYDRTFYGEKKKRTGACLERWCFCKYVSI